ncbi:uncharacterized protein LOC113203405 isoform X2 [Frankliniella occidentalis]|uniref:Uncharacterized protein LOC113203405 isoform X2 n=1 Tax=Frankliniella occidentalis TaxID=133901 RepID=A0A6J1S529_FRAOC|nr:uncharacterized protein LOC113203405 isoform X2 [Frankliniella occidentalis]XP_052119753.1 uncharacterized protein LOC113203405 isoform X2 [Frankliniella occidentalis]
MEECPGQRDGSTIYYFDGHMYRRNRATDSSTYYRCSTRGCFGRVIQKHSLGTIVQVSPHCHPADQDKHSLRRFLAAIQRRVSTETTPIFDIYEQEASRFPGIENSMPFESLQQQMEKRRRLNETLNNLDTQQMQEQSGGRDDTSSLEATLGMGSGGGMMDPSVAGPSGYGDDVRVKMEPEWVDAGALEPNCELEGQYDDGQDFNTGYGEDSIGGQEDQSYHHMFGGQQEQEQPQPQQLPLIPDSQDPVKLRVPGKPNLTITVAPTRPPPTHSTPPLPAPPPLHLLNPLLNRKRGGRPRGSQYGSYSESDDRVTTILTDSIIASQKLEKMGAAAAAGYPHPSLAAAMTASLSSRVKPRSKDPEAVRAADIVNSAQNRSGPRVNEELEKVHLKLRQEVLALEVQNLKAEREKLKAYRRNVAIRREIMMLHLQLGKGIPSECASSGRGLETVDLYGSEDAELDNDLSNSVSKDSFSNSISKEHTITKLPEVSITLNQSSQSPKISIRKSLQTANQSPNVSPLSASSSVQGPTPPPGNVKKTKSVNKQHDNREVSDSASINESKQMSEGSRCDTSTVCENLDSPEDKKPVNDDPPDIKVFSEHENDTELSESKALSSCQQSVSSTDPGKDDLAPLDSVSSDLSIEMLSEPGSSQWTNQSSAPMTEHEGFDDLQFEGEDSYDNTDNIGEFSGGPIGKEPPDAQFTSFSEETAPKRRRVDNMWEPEDGNL